jgi:hypothetical protein
MQEEKYWARDLSYSAWHRAASIRRYVGWERAQLLTMCDADSVMWLEYHHRDKQPLALIEAAIDVGQACKPSTAITMLAKCARIPAYLVLYARSEEGNPADPLLASACAAYGRGQSWRGATCRRTNGRMPCSRFGRGRRGAWTFRPRMIRRTDLRLTACRL